MKRFERQINLRGLGIEGQNKLRKSSVLVVGAGGLGCPALLYLAAAGVGKIGIVDGDTVSVSNLNRQIIFGIDDEGKMKAIVAGKFLREKYDDIDIEIYAEYLDVNNTLDIFSNYDIVIDCTDNFSVRYMANDACVLLDKAFVYGAIYEYEGQLSLFNVKDKNGSTCNYRDLFPTPPSIHEIPNCAATGVIGALPGIIGTMQAAEAIKYITGIGALLIKKVLYYNMEYQLFYDLSIEPHPEVSQYIPKSAMAFKNYDYSLSCSAVSIIDWTEANEIFKRNSQQALFIDVREKDEMPIVENIPLVLLPLSQLEAGCNGISLPQNLLVFCQHGIRSVKAVNLLQAMFPEKNIYSIKGGVMSDISPINKNIPPCLI